MTGPAGRPTEARPTESTRPTESAAFETARVGGQRRGRPSIVAAGFVVVLVAIVAAGLSGRLGGGAFPKTGENAIIAASPDATDLVSEPTPTRLVGAADGGPMLTSGPGEVELQARRQARTVFVHADVYLPGVTWVFMSLRDDAGQIAGWASVSMPGAAGPAASGVPTLRFDVELAIPATFDGHLWVQAHAYDSRFGLIGSARVDTPVVAP